MGVPVDFGYGFDDFNGIQLGKEKKKTVGILRNSFIYGHIASYAFRVPFCFLKGSDYISRIVFLTAGQGRIVGTFFSFCRMCIRLFRANERI